MEAIYLEQKAFDAAFNSAEFFLEVHNEFNYKKFLKIASKDYYYQFYYSETDGYYVLGWKGVS
jgi:hypothetical protein